MGLFDFGKKYKKELKVAPLYYWEEQSYMLAVPRHMNEEVLSEAEERIKSIPGVELRSIQSNDTPAVRFVVAYDGEEYAGGMYVGDFGLSGILQKQEFYFSNEEWDELKKADKAVTIFLKFNNDAKKSFHLQLKLIVAMVPDLLGVMDESAERMLCARWVKMAASSNVTPGSKDLFTVQAIGGKDDGVWLHTHGLCRCGLTELEIVDSDAQNYRNHSDVINTFGSMLLDKKDNVEPRKSSFFLGYLSNNQPIVTTYVPWNEALDEYPKLKLGGEADRVDAHNSQTSIVFLYTSEENEKNQKLTKVTAYDKLWGDNPLFFFSNEETQRMRSLARERFNLVKDALQNGNHVLIKIGLKQDSGDPDELEHIWFELNEFDGERFRATLTQEPYNVSNIHTGDERWFTIEDVTDWMIYTKEYAVSPDLAYLLVD